MGLLLRGHCKWHCINQWLCWMLHVNCVWHVDISKPSGDLGRAGGMEGAHHRAAACYTASTLQPSLSINALR
jgi:hypothetical protein